MYAQCMGDPNAVGSKYQFYQAFTNFKYCAAFLGIKRRTEAGMEVIVIEYKDHKVSILRWILSRFLPFVIHPVKARLVSEPILFVTSR